MRPTRGADATSAPGHELAAGRRRTPSPPNRVSGVRRGALLLARVALSVTLLAGATALGGVTLLALSTALGGDTAVGQPELPDPHQHPVWGPALAAEAASVASDAPARTAAADDVARAAHGLSGWAQLRPSLTWRSPDGAAHTAFALSAGVEWRDDPVARFTAALDQHRGDVAAHERALRAVRAATGAYIDLRRAQVAVELAEAQLPARRSAVERAEAGLLAGGVSRNQRDVAALELERAQEAVGRAQRDLAAARHAAEHLGIDVRAAVAQHHALLTPEPLEGWRLPPPPDGLPHERLRRRQLERDLAAARLDRRGAFAILRDVRVDGSWSESGTRLRAGAGLSEGRPSAWADVAWTRGNDAWSLSLSARLRVDDGWEPELRRAERALADAEDALASAAAEAPWLDAEARRALAEAETDVAYAERALALGREALRELAAELEAAAAEERQARRALAAIGAPAVGASVDGAPAAGATADGRAAVEANESAAAAAAVAAAAEARLRRFEDAYRRAELGHLRERDAFLRAYERYLREAERLWAGVGWPFSVALGGHVGE
jgi:hypothetical protein